MIEIGPYRFTDQDAQATLRHAEELFALLIDGIPAAAAAVAEPFRQRALAATEAPLERALPAYWAELRAGAAAVRATGAYGDPAHGTVIQLSSSTGGVPKLAVPRAEVDFGGVVGDVQAARRHHGRPWQALCIWSAEVVDRFAADGHPIAYGSAGENITVSGIDWARVRPGVTLRVGSVGCEVVAYTLPCAKNARWFQGGDFNLMHHRQGPVSRVYALVTEPGVITTGDEFVVMPD